MLAPKLRFISQSCIVWNVKKYVKRVSMKIMQMSSLVIKD